MATEALCLWARKRPILLWDGSAALTGLLLALTLPPTLPLWMAVLGAAVAIGIGKHAFGGLGANPFNPALVGTGIPIGQLRGSDEHLAPSLRRGDRGDASGRDRRDGDATAICGRLSPGRRGLLGRDVGGGVAGRRGGARFCGGSSTGASPRGSSGRRRSLPGSPGVDPLAHVLSGGLLFGAFFMATDWVTSPITRKGKWIFAVGIGVLTMVIRLWAAAPEGVSFAILLMNGATPLINMMTRPKGSRE